MTRGHGAWIGALGVSVLGTALACRRAAEATAGARTARALLERARRDAVVIEALRSPPGAHRPAPDGQGAAGRAASALADAGFAPALALGTHRGAPEGTVALGPLDPCDMTRALGVLRGLGDDGGLIELSLSRSAGEEAPVGAWMLMARYGSVPASAGR